MSKIIKLKQKDVENVVLKVIKEQQDVDMDTKDSDMGSSNVDMGPQDMELEPSTEKILQSKNLEVRPDVTPETPGLSGVYIGRDAQGNYYVVDYKTGEIVGKKSGL